tara:strand:- start:106 stop:399 length:294 start_codon:yes stop_codon:yes gene_type:complete
MKKDLGSLLEQALENIKNDRQVTESLLSNLQQYMEVSKERYADAGTTAAKFVETLQRSNEQLVKIATIVHKKESSSRDLSLNEDDKRELFDIIKEDG